MEEKRPGNVQGKEQKNVNMVMFSERSRSTRICVCAQRCEYVWVSEYICEELFKGTMLQAYEKHVPNWILRYIGM